MKRVLDFTVVIEQDEDGMFVASVPDIPGCATQGETIPELLENAKEAIAWKRRMTSASGRSGSHI